MILAGGHIFALELNTFCWYSSIPKWKIYKGKEIIIWAKIWKSIAHQVIWVAFLARLFFHLHCYVGQIALLTLDIPICIWVWVTGVDVKERAPPRLQSVSLSSGITQLCSKHFHFGLNTWKRKNTTACELHFACHLSFMYKRQIQLSISWRVKTYQHSGEGAFSETTVYFYALGLLHSE